MLRNFDVIEGDPEPDLDLYFRQCSIEVNCRDLALMASTLATGGINPVTRERPLAAAHVDEVLSVMTTCGMYDYAGEWVYRIGLPAKSGVAGGILAVLPGQLGIGAFSPPLDARGNSVRGVAACSALSEEMELHFLRAPRAALSTLRSRHDLKHFRSRRIRLDGEQTVLAETGHQGAVYQLQGDLSFAAMEVVSRRVSEEADDVRYFVLDLSRVHDIDEPASQMVLELLDAISTEHGALSFVGLQRHPRLRRYLEEGVREPDAGLQLLLFEDLDLAVEWCEDRLLWDRGFRAPRSELLPLPEHGFLRGLDAVDVETLSQYLEMREFETRKTVVRKGDPADALFMLVRGEISVLTDTVNGSLRRLSTLSPGMGFGEPFLVEGATRTAFLRADLPTTCWVLTRDDFHRLLEAAPVVAAKLLQNLVCSVTSIVERVSQESIRDR
jgi:glutaminase